MTGVRLALVSDDARLITSIQNHLRRAINFVPSGCGFDDIREHLAWSADGLLLLAVSSSPQAEQALRLVQEIYLQQLPPVLVVVENETLPQSSRLTALDGHVARRLRWPDDADALMVLLRERSAHWLDLLATKHESVGDIVERTLMEHTPSLLPMVERISIAAEHDVTVLLTGETGTGKTFLARLMHHCSPRRKEPILTVPCGAQPANLIESAFFGHVKGAFTGADRTKIGKFEAAGNGTILLDEIDTLPLETQASLLRVIETGEYEPVGSNETKRSSARIIVASNWDLEDAVERGKFRQDLYYRLNVMSFHLPPLRERVQDIAPLVRAIVARYNTKFRKDLFDINELALDALESFSWPGNLRQLENFLQQAVLVSRGTELLREHLPQQVRDHLPFRPAVPIDVVAPSPTRDSLKHTRAQIERNVIQRALSNNGYNRSRTASALGISRVTLYKKMKSYGLMSQESTE
jgi:DNA-binding NtrC family response regulator